MSAKTDFIRAIVQEGITAARKYFGTAIQKDIPTKEIERAKQKFKNNKKDDTARKNIAAKKANKTRAKANTTQLKKTSTRNDQEGASGDPETGRSVSAARDAESGKAGKVTRGSKSITNFITDQMALSPGMQGRRKQDKDFARRIREAGSNKEKEQLQNAYDRVKAKRKKADEKQKTATGRKISTSLRGRKKPVDNYGMAIKQAREDGVVESEYTKDLTPLQKEQVEKAARSTLKSKSQRTGEAITEEKNIQAGRTKPGETSVGPRKGSRGMRTRTEEAQVKGMLTGKGERRITDLSADNEEELRKRLGMNQGGKVTKRAIGSHDFRMNKGGLLLSSVDNRKNK